MSKTALFYKAIQKAAVGTTVNVPESVGTLSLNSVSHRVLGFFCLATLDGTVATAEGHGGRLLISSSDLGLNKFEMPFGSKGGGAMPTHIAGNLVLPNFVPLNIPCSPNAAMTVESEILIESSADINITFICVYDDGSTPAFVVEALHKLFTAGAAFPAVVGYGKTAYDVDIGDALSEDFANTAKIPAKYKAIIAVELEFAQDAVQTAGEDFNAYLQISLNNVDISPEDLQLPMIGQDASLGTAVASSPLKHARFVLPLWIPLGGAETTITPTIKLQVVTSGANFCSATFYAI